MSSSRLVGVMCRLPGALPLVSTPRLTAVEPTPNSSGSVPIIELIAGELIPAATAQ